MIGGKKWEKGQSGNPLGRPKSNFSFKKELETKLGEVNERDYLKRTYGRIMIDRAVDLATRKNPSIRAMSEILDRLLGKPMQAVANLDLNLTREQRLAVIEDLLATLPKPPEPDGPGDPRVN